MKRAILAATALMSSTMMSTPAFADFTDGTADITGEAPAGITPGAAQAVCNALATAHGGTAPLVYHGTLEEGSISGEIVSGPTANGARTGITNSTGIGPQIPETVQVQGDPFRIGGSVNMFGFAKVVGARWTDSEYDFSRPYAWTSDYSFTCNMKETVPTPALGLHHWTGPSNADQHAKDECEFTQSAHVNDDRGANCEWVQTIPAGTTDEDRDDETGSILGVSEGGDLSGHENHGGSIPVDPDAVDLPPVQVVVCISPVKKAGTWTAKNGYTTGSFTNTTPATAGCNTNWYNTGAITTSPYTNINSSSNNIVTIP